jgi:hypothetical protein
MQDAADRFPQLHEERSPTDAARPRGLPEGNATPQARRPSGSDDSENTPLGLCPAKVAQHLDHLSDQQVTRAPDALTTK